MTARTLPGIGLTGDIDQGAPWKVAGDRNWLLSSVLTQTSVESATTALPASPLNGVMYIVPAGDPSFANQIAARDNGEWSYFPPQKGWTAYVRDTGVLMNFDGTAWSAAATLNLQGYTALVAYPGKSVLVNITTPGIAGFFRYNAALPNTTNGGTQFAHASGIGAWERLFTGDVNILWWITGGLAIDNSAAAIAAIAAHNRFTVPQGITLIVKNVECQNDTQITVFGGLKLPAGCSDFDRCIFASGKSGIKIVIQELDGNYANQSGNIGTHLIYLTNCPDPFVRVNYAHDHYIASGAPMPSVDGIRDTSTGGVFAYQCLRADVQVARLRGWGREGVQLRLCDYARAAIGAQGVYDTEYSGLQMSGMYGELLWATVDYAGASAVGFDMVRGVASNIVATNTRANHGLNMGHPGFPASGSVVNNLVVDGCLGMGVSVAAGSKDVAINNFNISYAGIAGGSFSDGSIDVRLANGVVKNSAQYNLNASVTQVYCANVKSSEFGAKALSVSSVVGTFVEGEAISTGTGSATLERRVIGLSATAVFFPAAIAGTFTAAQTITGGTSGATATITTVYTPVQRNESSGGLFVDTSRYFPGTLNQTRFDDGTAICSFNLPCAFAVPGVVQTFSQAFSSNVKWIAAPGISVSAGSFGTTNTADITRLSAVITGAGVGTGFDIRLNATVAQTYGIQVTMIGRWR